MFIQYLTGNTDKNTRQEASPCGKQFQEDFCWEQMTPSVDEEE